MHKTEDAKLAAPKARAFVVRDGSQDTPDILLPPLPPDPQCSEAARARATLYRARATLVCPRRHPTLQKKVRDENLWFAPRTTFAAVCLGFGGCFGRIPHVQTPDIDTTRRGGRGEKGEPWCTPAVSGKGGKSWCIQVVLGAAVKVASRRDRQAGRQAGRAGDVEPLSRPRTAAGRERRSSPMYSTFRHRLFLRAGESTVQ